MSNKSFMCGCGRIVKNENGTSLRCRSCSKKRDNLSEQTLKKMSIYANNRSFEHSNKLKMGFREVEFVEEGECWVCVSHKCTKDKIYPSIDVNGVKTLLHRKVFEDCRRKLIEGEVVMHVCDDRRCINPGHLKAGTQYDNIRDAVNKKRHIWGERVPTAKLCREDVVKIRESKKSQRIIAKEYGVSSSAIGLIRQRKNWALIE